MTVMDGAKEDQRESETNILISYIAAIKMWYGPAGDWPRGYEFELAIQPSEQ